ncbi:MAG: DM13 domain-containing protein [Acidimicrobiaceae bacterium]|nr:DM13 domain-containing protein [Acidimicrobiaceae bacterium]
MRAFLRRNWKILVPVGVVGLAIAYYLVFVFFAFHLLFVDDKVNESGPLFDSGAVMTSEAVPEPSEPAPSEPAPESSEPAPSEPAPEPSEPAPSEPESSEPEPSGVESDEPLEVVRLVEGSFIDRSHPTEGVAVVLNDGTQQRFLRFEDFATDNGPDLNVYLSSAPPDASAGAFDDDFVDLGDLKGNIGAQNYEIPTDVDLNHHSTVVIWCVRFSVAFGAAELS